MTALNIDPQKLGLKVGIEIHQQLATDTKLFCSCPAVKSEQFPHSFSRRLRPAQSELGRVDPAALFEFSKGKANLYLWSPESSCLVEADEEPPHDLNAEAVRSTLMVALMLGSNVVDEIHVMRKIVIDGSNTTGFQRTAVVGVGGSVEVDGQKVGVQSVTLEEDAARIMGEDGSFRRYALDRLGVPLVEVALEPFTGTPEMVGELALRLGRALRSTGRVARGLGTIRQDLNVSLRGGKVVEVKGVQKLNLVRKVVAYEVARQLGLAELAARLKGRGGRVRCSVHDATGALSATASKVLRRAIDSGGKVACVCAPGLSGLLGWEPQPGVRLGREVAEVARANALGGVIHSDEFSQQGVSPADEAALRQLCSAPDDAALVLVAGAKADVDRAVGPIAERIERAPDGVPPETRGATEDGETRYMRPRPGAQRMYPETDIPDLAVTKRMTEEATGRLPERWDERVERYQSAYSLSRDLALRLYDSGYSDLFEDAVAKPAATAPSVLASLLVDLPPRLVRDGVPEERVDDGLLLSVYRAVAEGVVAKEAAFEVALAVGSGRAATVSEAVAKSGLKNISGAELEGEVDQVLAAHSSLVQEKGEAAFSVLMGAVMQRVRGRADGRVVSDLLLKKLKAARAGRRS